MPVAKTGDLVYWADGKITAFNDTGISAFPSNDAAFFRRYGINWATPPTPENGLRGVRQRLSVDAETIQMVARLMELMAGGDNEWNLTPPFREIDFWDAAATKFPYGWAGSQERRKYLPGSVPSDNPRPPAPPKPPVIVPPPVPPPPPPPPAPAGLRPLSPASQRAEELRVYAEQIAIGLGQDVLHRFGPFLASSGGGARWPIVKVLLVEAIRAWRLIRRHHLGDGRPIPPEDQP